MDKSRVFLSLEFTHQNLYKVYILLNNPDILI